MTTGNTTSKRIFKSNICQTRTLKVREGYHSYQHNQPFQQRTEIALIEFKGHWLVEAGFKIGMPIDVRVMPGCLVATINPQSHPSLNGFNQLKANEQRVIKDILGGFLKLKGSKD